MVEEPTSSTTQENSKGQRHENERHMQYRRQVQERDRLVDKCNIIVKQVNRDKGPFQMTLSEFLQLGSFQEMELIDIATHLAGQAHLPDIQFSESHYEMDFHRTRIRKEIMTKEEVEEEIIKTATIKITDTSKIDKAIHSALEELLRKENKAASDSLYVETNEFLKSEAIKEYNEGQVMSSIRRQALAGARMGYMWGPSNHVWARYPIWI
jgi:hypothetical protein